jgi:hypothetical protein
VCGHRLDGPVPPGRRRRRHRPGLPHVLIAAGEAERRLARIVTVRTAAASFPSAVLQPGQARAR